MRKKIAIVQSPPVFMNLQKTIALVIRTINIVADKGADIIMFPEAYLPGYPDWMWRLRPGKDFTESKKLHRLLVENSVDLLQNGLGKIKNTAKKNKITVAIGMSETNSEASRTTLYNTFVVIGPDGEMLNIHRKLVPTSGERMIWGRGDGNGLNVIDTPAGRIGSLICWENYMPLSRFALYAQGVELYLAPTWDYGAPWVGTLSHIARESGAWVASSSTALQGKDIPKNLPYRKKMYTDNEEWINNGDAVLINPFGDIVSGPMRRKKGILYAEYDLKDVIDRRRSLDVAGHYSRPDIFGLTVKKSKLKQININ